MQTHWVLPFWFVIARAIAVVLIWFLWSVGKRLPWWLGLFWEGCFVSLQFPRIPFREESMSVHNPLLRLVIFAAIGLLRDEPLSHLRFRVSTQSSTPPLFVAAAVFGRRRKPWRLAGRACLWLRLPLGAWCKASPRNLTSSAGWPWCPACSEGSPQVSRIQEPGRVLMSWRDTWCQAESGWLLRTRGLKSSGGLKNRWDHVEIPYKNTCRWLEEEKGWVGGGSRKETIIQWGAEWSKSTDGEMECSLNSEAVTCIQCGFWRISPTHRCFTGGVQGAGF